MLIEEQNLDNIQNPQMNMGVVSRSAFSMPIRLFEKMFCKHKNKTEMFRCYQDRYVIG